MEKNTTAKTDGLNIPEGFIAYDEYLKIIKSEEYIQYVGGREVYNKAIRTHKRKEIFRVFKSRLESFIVFVLSVGLVLGIINMIIRLF